MKEYTLQVFLPNKGTVAKHRITSCIHITANTIPEAYAKAKEMFNGEDVSFGFIIQCVFNKLPGVTPTGGVQRD
jgi:hypothetical protein